MTWNYRIILHDLDANPERHWFGLHEVFYGMKDGIAWTENPTSFVCDADETKDGVIKALDMAIKDAARQPILRESDETTWPAAPRQL